MSRGPELTGMLIHQDQVSHRLLGKDFTDVEMLHSVTALSVPSLKHVDASPPGPCEQCGQLLDPAISA